MTPKTRVFLKDGLWQHYCPKTREFMRYWFWESAIQSANNCTKLCRKDEET